MPFSPVDFLRSRWRGKVDLTRLFWFDMLTIATGFNVILGFVSLLMLAKRVDWPWVLAVHMLMLPYNAFLVTTVWRHAKTKLWMKAGSSAWMMVFIAV